MGMGLLFENKNGKLRFLTKGENLITNLGKQWMAERWAFAVRPTYPNNVDAFEVGTGTAQPTAADIALDTTLLSVAATEEEIVGIPFPGFPAPAKQRPGRLAP